MTARIASLPSPAGLDLLAQMRHIGPQKVRAYDALGDARDIDVQGTRRRWENVANILGTMRTLTRVEFLGESEQLLGQWQPDAPPAEPPPPEERALALLLKAQDSALMRQEGSLRLLVDGYVRLAEANSRACEAQASRAAAAEAEAARLRGEVADLQLRLARAKADRAESGAGKDTLTGDAQLTGLVRDVALAAIETWVESKAAPQGA